MAGRERRIANARAGREAHPDRVDRVGGVITDKVIAIEAS